MEMSEKIKNYSNITIGAGAGFATYKLVSRFLVGPLNRRIMLNEIKKLKQKEHIMMWEKANEAFRQHTNLEKKGVKLYDVTQKKWKSLFEKFIKEDKDRISIPFIEKYFQNAFKKGLKDIANGKNAGYTDAYSAICVNKSKMGVATFHEIGHALIWKQRGLGAFNSGCSNILALSIPLVLAIGLLKNKKQDNQKPKEFLDRTTTFIKNNCGLIVGAIMIPKLIDEAAASINGSKLAKSVLNKNMHKKLNKFNSIAFSTYVIGTLMMAGVSQLAVKIRDKIVDYKPINHIDI